jgi:trk system potassium uptake protein TrkA
MRFVVIGLGNFGVALSRSLAGMGHEVIGVDSNIHKVEQIKDAITTAIVMDSRDAAAVSSLPVTSADAVFVAIGEDFGSSVNTIAILKQMGVKRLIARAIDTVHSTILEAIGVSEILRPEQDFAEMYAARFELSGVEGSFLIGDNRMIMEIKAPSVLVGQRIEIIGFEKNFKLPLLAIKYFVTHRSLLGTVEKKPQIYDQWEQDRIVEKDDILVLYGQISDFHHFKNL